MDHGSQNLVYDMDERNDTKQHNLAFFFHSFDRVDRFHTKAYVNIYLNMCNDQTLVEMQAIVRLHI